MTIDTKTNILCSIANPGADLTGVLYNAIIESLDANAVYLPTTCNDVYSAFTGAKALGFKGLSVSMPHKQSIMEHLDFIEQNAEEIGAVNTVVNQNDKWGGFNTDWYGAVQSLQEKTAIENKRVLLFGAGGAAKAIAYGLVNSGANFFVHNKTTQKGQELANRFGGNYLTRDELFNCGEFEILVNATSIGFMEGNLDDHFIPRELIHNQQIVLDVVFSPINTKLIADATQKNAVAIPGYKMLIHQALLQFKLWLDQELNDYSEVENRLIEFISNKGL